MKKLSTLLLVGILAVLFVVVYTAYTFWQNSKTKDELATLNHGLTVAQDKVLQYENERVLQSVAAKQTLDELKASNVQWSKVIKDIRDTLPVGSDGNELVDVLSYSGSSNSDISLNLKTLPGTMNPFLDVAKVIASFDKSDLFVDSFVSSIGISTDKDGKESLSFPLNTKYVGKDAVAKQKASRSN